MPTMCANISRAWARTASGAGRRRQRCRRRRLPHTRPRRPYKDSSFEISLFSPLPRRFFDHTCENSRRMQRSGQIPLWTIGAPIFAGAVLLAAGLGMGGGFIVAFIAIGLAGSVFAAVHHAESDRAPGRRTLRHLGAGAGGHSDRGRAHRVLDERGRRGSGGLGARHGIRGRDDHFERHHRIVPAGRRRQAPRTELQPRRRRRRAGGARHHRRHDSGVSQLHRHHSRAVLFTESTHTHRRRHPGDLRRIRFHSNHRPPAVLSAR